MQSFRPTPTTCSLRTTSERLAKLQPRSCFAVEAGANAGPARRGAGSQPLDLRRPVGAPSDRTSGPALLQQDRCNNDNENADERTRTSTWSPRHGPEPCADRVDASAGVQIVRVVRVSGHIGHIGRYDCCQNCCHARAGGSQPRDGARIVGQGSAERICRADSPRVLRRSGAHRDPAPARRCRRSSTKASGVPPWGCARRRDALSSAGPAGTRDAKLAADAAGRRRPDLPVARHSRSLPGSRVLPELVV
jgi:hypothetical protein